MERHDLFCLRDPVCLFLLVAVGISSLCAAGPDQFTPKYGSDKFARVEYPATGNITLNEGTVEMWIRVEFDPNRRHHLRYYSPMTYFWVGCDSTRSAHLSIAFRSGYNSSKDENSAALSVSGSLMTMPLSAPVSTLSEGRGEVAEKWRRGQWHHLAVTWEKKGRMMHLRLFIDGVPVDSKEERTSAPPVLAADAVIRIGARYHNSCYATIDSLRLSAVVRSQEEIAGSVKSGHGLDRFTLLLDEFEKIGTAEDGRRAHTTAMTGDRGSVTGSFEQVPGRFGDALKLNTVEE